MKSLWISLDARLWSIATLSNAEDDGDYSDLQPRPEASLSQEQDTFYLLPRLHPSPYVVVGSKRRKLNCRKAVSFGFVQVREIERPSEVLEERRQLPKSILLKHPRQRNTSNRRVVWDDNFQIQLIPRLSEDEDEIVSRNHHTEEEDDFTVDGSSFVNDDEEDDRDDGYGEAIGDVVDVVEELIVVNEKKEKKKKKSTSPRRSLRLQTSNLGSAFTETGRRFSLRLKALK